MKRIMLFFVFSLLGTLATHAVDPESVPEIVAKVGDEAVTREDLLSSLEQSIGGRIRDSLFQTKIIEQEMRKRHIVISDEAVEARIKAMWQQGGAPERGETMEAFRRGVRIQLAVEMMVKQDLRMHQQLPVSNLKIDKWIKGKLNKARIVGREERLPEGAYAMVNGDVVTKEEFYRTLLLNTSEEELKRSLDKLIDRLVIQATMHEKGVDVSDFDIELEFKRMEDKLQRDPFRRGLGLEDVLRIQGTSKYVLKNDPDFVLTIGAKKLLRGEISEEEARKYCEDHKALYGNGEVRASQIFVAFVDLNTRRIKGSDGVQDARRKIEEIESKLDEGVDFAELARKYSEDDSAKRGGDLGFFPRFGNVPDPVAGVAFSLAKGEISAPFASRIGYHIVKVTDMKVPGQITFDAVKAQVIDDMLNARLADYLEKLRKERKVVTYWP